MQLRAIGVPAESVTYDPIRRMIEVWPEDLKVTAEDVIRATDPKPDLMGFLFKKKTQ